MNNIQNITAVLDQPRFLEDLVERLASRRYDLGYSKAKMPAGWQPVEVASTETFVSGTLRFDGYESEPDGLPLNFPFITPMLFTCIKEGSTGYRLLWSSSLS